MASASISLPSLPRVPVVAAVVRRDYHVARSYRLPFALDLLYGVINLVVFFFISRTFLGASTASLDGAPDYFAFAAVGVALTIVIGAATAGLAARIREEQLTGTLEALLTQPLTTMEIALGLAVHLRGGLDGRQHRLRRPPPGSGPRCRLPTMPWRQ